MSEFKKELLEIVNKHYLDCQYIEIKVDKSFMTMPPTVEIRVME